MRSCCFPVFLIITVLMISATVSHAGQPLPKIVDMELEKRVVGMLSGFEDVPNEKQWKALDGNVKDVLIKIAMDKKHWPARRARAVSALAYFADGETKEFLSWILTIDEKVAPLLQRKALYALAKGFGSKAVIIIAKKLDTDNVYVREAAIKSLASIATPDAIVRMEQRKAIEPEPLLRKLIDDELARMPRK